MWLREMETNGVGAHRRADAYRLLRAALNTAVTDHLIARNPCNVRGGGTAHTPEREPVELAKVFELADAVPARWRALVLLAAFATVRWGELVGLRRVHVDLDACTVRVAKSGIQPDTGPIEDGDPKSAAGFRTVNFPDLIVPDLRAHLDSFVGPNRRTSCSPARVGAGLAGTTFTGSGARRGSGSACRRSTCTTSVTPPAPTRPKPGRRCS
jgi:integrase